MGDQNGYIKTKGEDDRELSETIASCSLLKKITLFKPLSKRLIVWGYKYNLPI